MGNQNGRIIGENRPPPVLPHTLLPPPRAGELRVGAGFASQEEPVTGRG